jgi:ribosomal protein L40E
MLCTKCNNDNPVDASFCEECGTRLGLICRACKAPVSSGARFCKKCGTAVTATDPDLQAANPSESPIRVTANAGSASQAVEGERKMVTALFADIKGSMDLMEDLDPEEARAIVDPAIRLMIDAAGMERIGSTKRSSSVLLPPPSCGSVLNCKGKWLRGGNAFDD